MSLCLCLQGPGEIALILGLAKRAVLFGAIDNMTVRVFTCDSCWRGGGFVVQDGMERDGQPEREATCLHAG